MYLDLRTGAGDGTYIGISLTLLGGLILTLKAKWSVKDNGTSPTKVDKGCYFCGALLIVASLNALFFLLLQP